MCMKKYEESKDNSIHPYILMPKDLWRDFCKVAYQMNQKPRLLLVLLLKNWINERAHK